MSEIEIGNVWIDAGGTDLIVTDVTEHHIEYIYRSKYGRSLNEMEFDLFNSLFKPVEQGKKDDSVDMVNHPPHYKDASGIECIEVTSKMSFCGGSCFKYLYRCGKKHDDIEDLKKAAKYADWAWENEEVVPCEVLEDIWLISSHRSGNVSLAMDFIAEDMWVDAKKFIEREIARLESE